MKRGSFAIAAAFWLVATTGLALADNQQGFETDVTTWDVFGGPFDAIRVASGTNGVTSAAGSWHALAGTTTGPATNWGGYNCLDVCADSGCATVGNPFPPLGYSTSIDIWLDVNAGLGNDTRFDFTSAINLALPSGSHRRDFIFNAGFYNDSDGSPGSGTNRFVISASNNSQPGSAFAKNPGKDPIAIGTTGWYTFRHDFYDSGGGVLAVDMTIRDAGGTLIKQWTLSDVTDIIGVTVGGNRYGWFDYNQIPNLPFDNATIIGCTPSACCLDGPGTQSDCVIDRSDSCDAVGGVYLGDGIDCSAQIDCTELVVTFESITARATREGTLLEWTTVNEIDTVGFRLLREDKRSAEKTLHLVEPLIPAAGDTLQGASYRYLDTGKHPASSVYFIEDIDVYGRVTRHGPIAIQQLPRSREAAAGGRGKPRD